MALPTALPARRPQLESYLQSLYDEGIINGQFAHIQAMQDAESPDFVNEVMTVFRNDTDKILEEMNGYLSQENFECSQWDFCIHQLFGSTASIGAHRLKLACDELREAADDKSKERCVEALNTFTREYYDFLNKLQVLLQMEKGAVHCNGFHSTDPVTE